MPTVPAPEHKTDSSRQSEDDLVGQFYLRGRRLRCDRTTHGIDGTHKSSHRPALDVLMLVLPSDLGTEASAKPGAYTNLQAAAGDQRLGPGAPARP